MKTFEGKNGAYVTFEKTITGLYVVVLRLANGEIGDKVRCDDYRDACAYRRAFLKIAKRG